MSYQKTPTEQAYMDLLLGPVPQTGPDFRRAIVMAVLIGRQLEAEFAGSPWQDTPPNEPGVWEVACAETNFEPSRVRVFRPEPTSRLRPLDVLWVECPNVGSNPVDTYHHNLIQTRWRKPAP